MLFIQNLNACTYQWHIREKIPNLNIEKVCALQADGEELDKIQEMFPRLTAYGKRVVYFYGDIARTILLNLAR